MSFSRIDAQSIDHGSGHALRNRHYCVGSGIGRSSNLPPPSLVALTDIDVVTNRRYDGNEDLRQFRAEYRRTIRRRQSRKQHLRSRLAYIAGDGDCRAYLRQVQANTGMELLQGPPCTARSQQIDSKRTHFDPALAAVCKKVRVGSSFAPPIIYPNPVRYRVLVGTAQTQKNQVNGESSFEKSARQRQHYPFGAAACQVRQHHADARQMPAADRSTDIHASYLPAHGRRATPSRRLAATLRAGWQKGAMQSEGFRSKPCCADRASPPGGGWPPPCAPARFAAPSAASGWWTGLRYG